MLQFLQRAAFRRFREGRPGPWGAVAVGVFGVRTLARWAKRNEEVVYREVLRPGEQVVVTHRTETRRALRRAEARAPRKGRRGARHLASSDA